MAGQHLEKHARRVVSTVDAEGRSAIASDGDTSTRVATDAFTINQIWQVSSIPQHVLAPDDSGSEVSIAPPGSGFIYLVTTFPPDSEWDPGSGYADALAQSGDGGSHVDSDSGIAGLHETDTVDIVTVISGELYAVMEQGEVCLRPGDSFVQRGTKHAWSNRGDTPATIVAVMMGATR